jgi:hypothetical protein
MTLEWRIMPHSSKWVARTPIGLLTIREAKNAARIRVYQAVLDDGRRIAQKFTHAECKAEAEFQVARLAQPVQ